MLTESQFEERLQMIMNEAIKSSQRANQTEDRVARIEHNSERAAYEASLRIMRHGKV